LNELLAVADARFELGQYVKAGDIYYGAYHAAMHNTTHMNNPLAFLIAHKMIQAWVKGGYNNYLNRAHRMAQQNCMMPGHPPYAQKDLKEVEGMMKKKGMTIQRFGMGMGGF